MGSTNAMKPLAQRKKSPWRNKSTPPGPRGLHPAGALARTHRGLEYETPSRQEPLRAESRQNLKESSYTLPEARGQLSDTIKRGTLSKNRKNCLDPVNNETKIQPQANPPHPRPDWTARPTSNKYPGSPEAGSAQNHTARPRTRFRFSDSPEAPLERPRMRYRFSISLEAGSASAPPQL